MPNFVYFAFPIPGLCKYTDMSVGQTLPGSSTPFTLENYKSDLLKPHSKLHFGCVSRMSLRMLTVAPVMMPFVLHRWRLTKGSQQLLLVCHSIPLYHSHPHQPSSTLINQVRFNISINQRQTISYMYQIYTCGFPSMSYLF